MLSLPLIPPRPDTSLWPSLRNHQVYTDPQQPNPQNPNPTASQQRRPGSNADQHGQTHPRSLLSTLHADENTIEQRKLNVRRFGAGWIRPPGVSKTYQATMDEAAEREEQAMIARREQVLLDLAAAQQDSQNAETRAQGEDEDMDGEGERDLDDDVPEAAASESDAGSLSAGDETVSVLEEGDTSALGSQALAHGHEHEHTQADMTFNEDSFIEGSMVAAEVEHMLEMEEAELAGVLQDERDLDEDVPEAGSYEHTDSELEASSSDVEGSFVAAGATATRISSGSRRQSRRSAGRRVSGRIPGFRGAGVEHGGRSSIGLEGSSSFVESSSFLRSSPAAVRGSLRAQFLGARGSRPT